MTKKTVPFQKKKITDDLHRPVPLRTAFPKKITTKPGPTKADNGGPLAAKSTESPAAPSPSKEKISSAPPEPTQATTKPQPTPVASKETSKPRAVPPQDQNTPPSASNKNSDPANGPAIEDQATPAASNPFNRGGKLDLSTFRQKVDEATAEQSDQNETAQPLEEAAVQQIWQQHIARLKSNEKKQAANIMDMATIHIVSEAEIEISCRNTVQKYFIKDQQLELAEELKRHFHNDGIQVMVKVDDSLREKGEKKKVLTKREQLETLMQKYPLVRELKEGLNLDLG